MKFVELDLLGVYVSPLAIMMVLAYAIQAVLKVIGLEAGLFRWVWHPALFGFAVYVIILSCLVLASSLWRPYV